MIDEDLYQQAADELNSDKRRPHIWARACALASDDHDEARFLYTNLRVEELIAERDEAAVQPDNPALQEIDSTLALSPIQEPAVEDDSTAGLQQDDAAEFLSGMGVETTSEDAPSSFSAPSGTNKPESPDDFLALEPVEHETPNDSSGPLSLDEDPDSHLLSDYVPESTYTPDADLDKSFIGESLVDENQAADLEKFRAEYGETAQYVAPEQPGDATDHDELLDSTTDLNAIDMEAHAIDDDTLDATVVEDPTTELTAALQTEDLTQSNMDVLDAHSAELDEMLEDANYKPPQSDEPDIDIDMAWLDDEDEDEDEDRFKERPPASLEPVIYEEDPLAEDLQRQADELEIGDSSDQTADTSQQIADELSVDPLFPEKTEDSSAELPAAAMTAAVAGSAILATTSPDIQARTQSETTIGMGDDTGSYSNQYPLDLTEGRKGKEFSVFGRNGETQAVKNGVSWSALFFTMPYLLYRKLFGTALAYLVLWIVALGGLLLCGLAWLDAGTSVTPIVQAGTIAFALLAFIGLVYLPFRYGNKWRSEKLENHGYHLVAITKAKNNDLAEARARRHLPLDALR